MEENVKYWLYMGNSLFYGREGAVKNPEKAKHWFEMAAEAGCEEAAEMLNTHYGDAVADDKEADESMARKKKSSKEKKATQGDAAGSLLAWMEAETARHKDAEPLSMEEELQLCRDYAEQGYKLAQENYETMRNDLAEMKERLEEANRAQGKLSRIANEKLIDEQTREMKRLEASVQKIRENIDLLHERQKDFSIVIYGRTMAGKSTLMEILTHGDGNSIGKGAQRTTLDVRDYYWQGLKITDVPGTCSFGGNEDDRLALEAAKSADMALFLLTDDAPQPAEAERLAELRRLGKPVLGIVNVKQTLSPAADKARRKVEIKAITKKVNDQERLDAIVGQFREFAKNYGQDFSDIPFVHAHLKAAFLSQAERENDAELYKLSQFEEVEKFILEKVRKDGKFIRIKTFVDSVARPMQNAIAHIYGHSAETLQTANIFSEKLEQLDEWHKRFFDRAQERCNNFMEGLESRVGNEINSFVDSHYDDSDKEEAWKERIQAMHLDRECDIFIRKLSDEATEKMHELSDELTQDLHYLDSAMPDMDISVSVTDFTDYGDWMRTLGLGAFLLGPLGWLGLGATFLGSLFFDSRSDKIRKAKKELREALEKSSNEMLLKIREGVSKVITEKILGEQIRGFRETLESMEETLLTLAHRQQTGAGEINERYRELNLSLLRVAEQYIGAASQRENIQTARVVGQEFLLLSREDVPSETCEKLSALLGENVIPVVYKSERQNDKKRALEDAVLHTKCEWAKPLQDNEDSRKREVLALPEAVEITDAQRQLAQQMMEAPMI